MLTIMRMRHRRHLDVAGSLDWYKDPPRDLKTLDADLTTTNTSLTDLKTVLDGSPYAWAAGLIKYDTTTGTYSLVGYVADDSGKPKHALLSVQSQPNAEVSVVVSTPPTGFHVVSVSVVPYYNTTPRMISAKIDQGSVYDLTIYFKGALANGNASNGSFYFTVFISKD
jgi:hypothetical protein